jgi:hypothetical protein
VKLVVLGNIPIWSVEPNLCYQIWSNYRADCDLTRLDRLATTARKSFDRKINVEAKKNGYHFIDLMSFYENILMEDRIYFNKGHLSNEGALLAENLIRTNLVNPKSN